MNTAEVTEVIIFGAALVAGTGFLIERGVIVVKLSCSASLKLVPPWERKPREPRKTAASVAAPEPGSAASAPGEPVQINGRRPA